MTQMHTGSATFIRPSLGSWVVYGLGTENESMPGFLPLNPPAAGAPNYNSAFLPSVYSGARLGRGSVRSTGPQKAADIANPELSRKQQRRQIDFIQQLNRHHQALRGEVGEIKGLLTAAESRDLQRAQETAKLRAEFEAFRSLTESRHAWIRGAAAVGILASGFLGWLVNTVITAV